jgi:predicted  nucleic acid-binding Zn-ribbon protein
MSLLDRLGELAKAVFTTEAELRHLRDGLSDIRQAVHGFRMDVQDVRERLVRLETSRQADRSQVEAEIARFKVEVERAELRLSRLPPAQQEPPALPSTES